MTGRLARDLDNWLRFGGSQVGDIDAAGIAAAAGSLADLLRSREVQPNEPVHVVVSNRPTDLGAMLGVWLAGAVAVPIHHAASPTTQAAIIRATGARFQLDGSTLSGLAELAPPPRPMLDGAALIMFTSGTTGAPKGVVLGHDALAGKVEVLARLLAFRPGDIVVLPLHLIFIFGIWVSLLSIRSGAKLVLVQKFSINAIMDLLEGGATILAAVPSMLRMLTSGDPLGTLAPRVVLTGGEALGTALKERLDRVLPKTGVFDLYGSTETGSCDFCLAPSDGMGAGSIGYPTENVAFRIVRDDAAVAAPDEVGELQVRTPYGMIGYLDGPDLTAAAFDGDHYRTGDLARLRKDGRTEVVGRLKELISRGGNKISPIEIEGALCSHADIAAALCTGVPDPRYGEAIYAVVVLRPGACVTIDELKRWTSQQIERFKVPDVIIFSDVLPVGPTGKVSRIAIRSLAAGLHA